MLAFVQNAPVERILNLYGIEDGKEKTHEEGDRSIIAMAMTLKRKL